MIWNCGRFKFDSQTPVVMGILNVTPDSFSDGGQHFDTKEAIAYGHSMYDDGALIIDVGGESTRPGSAPVSEEEEISRVIDVVRALASDGLCVSVDTRHARVAQACVDAGASIINDVSGFRDPAMRDIAAKTDVGLVVMHMPGDPQTMREHTDDYQDVVADVAEYLKSQAVLLESMGVAHDRICIDPGPGFGKTPQQTIMLMRNLQEFRHLGYPILGAPSRKRFIGYMHDIDDPAERDEASADEALEECEQGASIVRMHNVKQTFETLKRFRPYVLLGLGGNVALTGKPGEEQEAVIAQLNLAIGDLCQIPDSTIIDVSSFYESEPAYFEDQPKFVNAVVLMRTSVAPHDLLDYLHAIENVLGRVREKENGPRTCDIDILDYQLYVCDDDRLVLPHPRLLERDFVVKPMMEIVPGHVLADGTPVTADHVKVGAATRIAY